MLLHPLFGAPIGPLFKSIWRHGGVRAKYWHLVALMGVQTLLRAPGIAIEEWRIRRMHRPGVSPDPPIFIIGHWRSGTTLCHNIISSDSRFFAPSFFETVSPYEFLSGLIRPLTRWVLKRTLPPHRPMDAVPVNLDMPMEEDMALAAMGVPSFFNCLYFPEELAEKFRKNVLIEPGSDDDIARHTALNWFCRKLMAVNPGQRLVLKSPGNSVNIAAIRREFPQAKFIHIYRHPEAVIASTCKMYRALMPPLALQTYNLDEIAPMVETTFPEVMGRLLRGASDLPKGYLAQIKYEDLLENPFLVISKVYQDLEIELTEIAQTNVLAELAKNPVVPQPTSTPKSLENLTRSAVNQKKIDEIAQTLGYL